VYTQNQAKYLNGIFKNKQNDIFSDIIDFFCSPLLMRLEIFCAVVFVAFQKFLACDIALFIKKIELDFQKKIKS
jgi:hypothetical protein